MILVTGAGGKTGRSLIRTLSQAESVFAFVHRDESVAVVAAAGAERAFVGDLRDGAALRTAMQGARAVYHICPNMSMAELEIGKSMVQEARAAGVEHFVYHSVLHPHAEKMPHHWQKLRVEESLFESGLACTILQPAPYMQNLLASWSRIVEEGVLSVPYSIASRFSFVDLGDVAEAAKVVLTGRGHIGAIYELVGENSLSYSQVAELLTGALQRGVRAETEPLDNWRKRTSGIPEHELNGLVLMFEYYDRWGLTGNSKVLGWLLQREPTSTKEFIARTVKERDAIH